MAKQKQTKTIKPKPRAQAKKTPAKRKTHHAGQAPAVSEMTRDRDDHRNRIWDALHYAQYDLGERKMKKHLISYAKKQELDHKLLNSLGDKECFVAGKFAYVVDCGGELPEEMQEGLDRLLNDLLNRAKVQKEKKREEAKEQEEESAAPKLSVQDRMRMQAEEVSSDFDNWLDDLAKERVKKVTDEMDPSKRMASADFKAGQARWVKKFYKDELKEIKDVLAGKDAELKEGYSNLKKSVLKRIATLLESIVNAATLLEKTQKAKRKTKTKKAPAAEKQVAKLKYLEKHEEYGIASESPVKIVGAKEVWVFNTKYRKLGRYIAADESGLSVKGTTIQNFAAGSQQKTLRKPKDQLADFMSVGKVKLRKYLDGIKAVETKLNGRMNENIVILRVVK